MLFAGAIMIKNQKIQRFAVVTALFVLACLPAACGVKPDMVDPPASVSVDTFPQTYPPTDDAARTPGRYLPPGYNPQPPKDKSDTQSDKGHTTP